MFAVGVLLGFSRGRDASRLLAAASSAPGAAEVRAAGCHSATVLSAAELRQTYPSVTGGRSELGISAAVFCYGLADVPDCARVARAFVSAPGRVSGEFLVSVERKQKPGFDVVCRRRFSDRGEDLGAFLSEPNSQR